MAGYVRLCRQVRKHWIYEKPEHFKTWFEMISCAKYTPQPEKRLIEGQLIMLEFGQFLFGYPSWSDRLNISTKMLRGLMSKLILDGMILLVGKYPKFSVYQIINYEKYNPQKEVLGNEEENPENGHEKGNQEGNQQDLRTEGVEADEGNQKGGERATEGQAEGKQRATYNKLNKYKHINIVYLEFFEKIWRLYPRKLGKGKVSLSKKQELYKVGYDAMELAIKRFKEANCGKEEQFIMHGSTFFNSGYVDYLDANFEDSGYTTGHVDKDGVLFL